MYGGGNYEAQIKETEGSPEFVTEGIPAAIRNEIVEAEEQRVADIPSQGVPPQAIQTNSRENGSILIYQKRPTDARNTKETRLGTIDFVDDLPVSGESASNEDVADGDRGTWSNSLEFLLSMVGYAVGLGNVWRFPYLCYQHGGAIFLIPYAISMVVLAFPIFLMEVAIGQYSSQGPVTCFKLAPVLTGCGYAMVMASYALSTYYNMIQSYALYYLYQSLAHATGDDKLPWSCCQPSWKFCVNIPDMDCPDFGALRELANSTICTTNPDRETLIQFGYVVIEDRVHICDDKRFRHPNNNHRARSPAEEFFERNVTGLYKNDDDEPLQNRVYGMGDYGGIQCHLFISLTICWVTVYFCLYKGVQSAGKAVYVTATLPMFLLLILFVRGCFLGQGALDGMKFYIVPRDWSKLLDTAIWKDATGQVFFSLSACWGGLISLASYNDFNDKFLKNCLITAFANFFTDVFAGFVVFAYIGHIAMVQNVDIADAATEGPDLAFVVYPQACNLLPLPVVWSTLFFLTLMMLAIDSEFVFVELMATTINDIFPHYKKWKVVGGCCLVGWTMGLILTTNGGFLHLTWMDYYIGNTWTIILCGIFETLGVSYLYGFERFVLDLELMYGQRFPIKWYWKFSWGFTAPVGLSIIFGMMMYDLATKPLRRGHIGEASTLYDYPDATKYIGVLCQLCMLFPIVFFPAIFYHRALGSTRKEKLRKICSPTIGWGPFRAIHRSMVTFVDGFCVSFKVNVSKAMFSAMLPRSSLTDTWRRRFNMFRHLRRLWRVFEMNLQRLHLDIDRKPNKVYMIASDEAPTKKRGIFHGIRKQSYESQWFPRRSTYRAASVPRVTDAKFSTIMPGIDDVAS